MSHNPEVVKSGYLTKSPPEGAPKMSQWRRRWFVLCDSRLAFPLGDRHLRLEYYQSESEARRLADPKGVVDLKNCSQVINREPVKGHRFVFDVHTNNRVFHLAADSAVDKHDWVRTLNRLLFTDPKSQAHPLTESKSVEALDVKAPVRAVHAYHSADNLLHPGIQDKHARRPVSYAGGLLNDDVLPGLGRQDLASRPLPGVPGQERKNWPLPPPPGQPKPAALTSPVSEGDEQDTNYELAAAPSDEDPDPAPYEVAVDINYEDVKLDVDKDTLSNKSRLTTEPQNYEVPVMLSLPSLQTTSPSPPVPPPRRTGWIASSSVTQGDCHGSLPNISESTESTAEAMPFDDIESGDYGHISQCSRRYSQPDCSIKRTSSPPISQSVPSVTVIPERQRRYYENVGGAPLPSRRRQDYSHLHF